jgi:hypothetical protein
VHIGLVLVQQRSGTAKGITFVTTGDETGVTNLITHMEIWEKYKVARTRASAAEFKGFARERGTSRLWRAHTRAPMKFCELLELVNCSDRLTHTEQDAKSVIP